MTNTDFSNIHLPLINLADYDYDLPKDKIAEFPLEDRSSSKMLVLDPINGQIKHRNFKEIANYLNPESLLILNSTKVMPARLFMKKNSGGRAELLLVEPILPSQDPHIAMSAKGNSTWRCIFGGKRIHQGTILEIDQPEPSLTATIISKNANIAVVEFSYSNTLTFAELIEHIGKVPLPPYIKRDSTDKDKSTYQTVYANENGSVAAPTAGLHFNEEIFSSLAEKKIQTEKLILHVGPGTFKPIDGNDISQHKMHSEWFSASIETIDAIISALNKNNEVCAVGTTSMRTIESLYWFGVLLSNDETFTYSDGLPSLPQWTPYRDFNLLPSPSLSLQNLKKWLMEQGENSFHARTSLFIVPGYKFRIVDALITNFHIPKSTLLLLVSAFIGKENWKKAYNEALKENYRFLSYGDSCFFKKQI